MPHRKHAGVHLPEHATNEGFHVGYVVNKSGVAQWDYRLALPINRLILPKLAKGVYVADFIVLATV